MSWMSKKTGRRKEKGGHKRINISVDKFTKQALDKIRKGDGNVSKFIEKQLNPVLRNLDPGEASPYVWAIEAYLKKQIIKAAKQGKPDLVQALASLATAIKDYRNLSGIPPQNHRFAEQPKLIKKTTPPKVTKTQLIIEFAILSIISIYGFIITKNLTDTALPLIANQTAPGTEIIRITLPFYPYLVLAPLATSILIYVLKAKHLIRGKPNSFL